MDALEELDVKTSAPERRMHLVTLADRIGS